MVKAPIGGLLYSLLHLGGFPNDLAFYSRHCGSGRILEMGCGDGRLGVHLCLGESSLTVLQQQQQEQSDGSVASPKATVAPKPLLEYVGVELCEPLALKARERLAAAPNAKVVVGDFLEALTTADAGAFDAVLVSANTLFATPRHAALLEQCATALSPGGVLLLDVYNSLPWHPEEGWEEIGGNGEGEGGDERQEEGEEEEEEGANDEGRSLLVRVQDEDGRDWSAYETDPEVDADEQRIVCSYEFKEAGVEGGTFTEELVHHYLLPEQLVRMLDTHRFAIDEIFGDFDEEAFNPEESEHLVVIARLRES
jgi:SAM-dependent methyltransferase